MEAPQGAAHGQPGDELVDVVDDDNHVVGLARRSEVFAGPLQHRSVAVLCRGGNGDIFVHRRTMTKHIFPGRYDMFISGGVRSGERYATAARRELQEELGITGTDLGAVFTYRYTGRELPQWIGVFEVRWSGPVQPSQEEIAWSAFLPEAVVRRRVAEWEFCPDSRDAFQRYLRWKEHS